MMRMMIQLLPRLTTERIIYDQIGFGEEKTKEQIENSPSRFRSCRKFGNQRRINASRPGVARLPPQIMLVTDVVGSPLAFIKITRLIVGKIMKLVTCGPRTKRQTKNKNNYLKTKKHILKQSRNSLRSERPLRIDNTFYIYIYIFNSLEPTLYCSQMERTSLYVGNLSKRATTSVAPT